MIYGQDASVSIHTFDGKPVAELSRESLGDLSWNRKKRDVTQCDLMTPDVEDLALTLGNASPWYHWVSVWEGDELVWTGPIQTTTLTRSSFTLSARDVATFAWRTRTPFARRWAAQSTTDIAADLFRAMVDLQGVHSTKVLTRPTPSMVGFDYQIAPDSRTMNGVLDDLVKMGLEWQVVAGTILVGPAEPKTVAALDEDDILNEVSFQRDGSRMYTDVRVQGQNFAHTEVVPGPRLQTLVNLDNVFGVSNIRNAAREYVNLTGRVLESVVVPSGSSLSPEAEIDLDMLVPGHRFDVFAGGRSAHLELTEVKAILGPNGYDFQVTLDTPVGDLPELESKGKS